MLFVPYALHDRDAYTNTARKAFNSFGMYDKFMDFLFLLILTGKSILNEAIAIIRADVWRSKVLLSRSCDKRKAPENVYDCEVTKMRQPMQKIIIEKLWKRVNRLPIVKERTSTIAKLQIPNPLVLWGAKLWKLREHLEEKRISTMLWFLQGRPQLVSNIYWYRNVMLMLFQKQ